jgi:hypothetical protein
MTQVTQLDDCSHQMIWPISEIWQALQRDLPLPLLLFKEKSWRVADRNAGMPGTGKVTKDRLAPVDLPVTAGGEAGNPQHLRSLTLLLP